jgi:hypothetical protein
MKPTDVPMAQIQQRGADRSLRDIQRFPPSPVASGEMSQSPRYRPENEAPPLEDGDFSSAFRYTKRKSPEIRIDIDSNSMPPTSTERNQVIITFFASIKLMYC